MQAEIKRYTKEQLLQAFTKKQDETIKKLIASQSGGDILSEVPFECVNRIKEQVQLDLNDGLYEQKQKPFRVQNDGGNFKRGFNDNNQQKFNKQRFGQPQGSGHGLQNHNNNGLKERIPVFVECGFETDSSAKVWYYKLSENVEGPFNSADMDEMLFTGQVWFDTRVVFKEATGKFVSIKKLITHTFGDKYNTVLETAIQPTKQIQQHQDAAKRGNIYKRNIEAADNTGNISRSSNVPLERTISDNSKEAQAKKEVTETKREIKDQPIPSKETQQPTHINKTSNTTHQANEPKSISTNDNATHLNQKKQPETSQIPQNQEKAQKKQAPKEIASEQKKAPQSNDINKPTVIAPVSQPVQISQPQEPQDLEGFQTVPGKSGIKNKKFNKKNATKIVVVGLSEQDMLAEENRKRLEEIRQHDLQLAQKYAAQQRELEKENPQKKIDIFDAEEKAQAVLSAADSFPALGGGSSKKAATQQGNKDVNTAQLQSDSHANKKEHEHAKQEGWIVNDKNKKKNNSKKGESAESDEISLKTTSGAIQNRDLEQKQWEQEQQLLAQEEKKRIEEFQQKQFAQNMSSNYREEEEQPALDSTDKDSFPSLGGSVYTGPPKNIVKPQANRNKGKNSKNAPSVPFSYPKTQENAWDIPSTGKQAPQKQQQQAQQVNSNAHQNKGNFTNDFPSL